MNIFKSWREPVSALTHLIALIMIMPFALYLVYKSYFTGGLYYVIAFSIFAISIISLYMASTVYHMLKVKERVIIILKKIDHMMIFFLIAGTYTPICLIALKGIWGYSIISVVWVIAILGLILKFFWIKAPRYFSTLIYVIMGWFSIVAVYPIIQSIQLKGILLLLFGGIIYTMGAIIYATKYPKLNFKYFGFHEIFHLFVIGGSVCHMIFMFKYIL